MPDHYPLAICTAQAVAHDFAITASQRLGAGGLKDKAQEVEVHIRYSMSLMFSKAHTIRQALQSFIIHDIKQPQGRYF